MRYNVIFKWRHFGPVLIGRLDFYGRWMTNKSIFVCFFIRTAYVYPHKYISRIVNNSYNIELYWYRTCQESICHTKVKLFHYYHMHVLASYYTQRIFWLLLIPDNLICNLKAFLTINPVMRDSLQSIYF